MINCLVGDDMPNRIKYPLHNKIFDEITYLVNNNIDGKILYIVSNKIYDEIKYIIYKYYLTINIH